MTFSTIKNSLKRLKGWKLFYSLTSLVGVAVMMFQVGIYRVTLIDVIIPISITFGVGLTAFMFSKNHYKTTYAVKGLFFPVLQNICSWGFIACYLFMASNYYLAEDELSISACKIESKTSMRSRTGRRNIPLVTIGYLGFKKELIFRAHDSGRVKTASKVKVAIKRGFFGFDIIDQYHIE